MDGLWGLQAGEVRDKRLHGVVVGRWGPYGPGSVGDVGDVGSSFAGGGVDLARRTCRQFVVGVAVCSEETAERASRQGASMNQDARGPVDKRQP